jgi:hypothetical protein
VGWLRTAQRALARPEYQRALHGWLAAFWAVLAVPSMIWWKDSIPYLVGLSVYAVVAGHLASWQSTKTEARQRTVEKLLDSGDSAKHP